MYCAAGAAKWGGRFRLPCPLKAPPGSAKLKSVPRTPRFTTRLDSDTRPNRLSRLLAERRRAGQPVLDLTESNPTRAGLPYDPGTILGPLADPAGLEYDPQPAGIVAAREAVAGYYASRGLPVDPARLVLTASTSEAYSYAFRLLTDPGDDVLAPAPSYPLFDYLARMDGIRLHHYFLHYDDGWWLDTASVRTALTDRTRAILAVHPNNPTGSFLKRREVAELVSICEPHGIPLIVDEVFADYRFRDDPEFAGSLAAQDDFPAIVVSGLSKVTGLPQMKLGWMVIAGPADWRDASARPPGNHRRHLPVGLDTGPTRRRALARAARALSVGAPGPPRRQSRAVAEDVRAHCLPPARRRGRMVRCSAAARHALRGGVGPRVSRGCRCSDAAGIFLRFPGRRLRGPQFDDTGRDLRRGHRTHGRLRGAVAGYYGSMSKRTLLVALAVVGAFLAGRWVSDSTAAASSRVYELRTYTATPGNLDNLQARFRDHTLRIFKRHGMENVGYWIPTDPARSGNTIIYLIAHQSPEAAEKSWQDFRADPDWVEAKAASEANGPIVDHVESVFMTPTDFSPLR